MVSPVLKTTFQWYFEGSSDQHLIARLQKCLRIVVEKLNFDINKFRRFSRIKSASVGGYGSFQQTAPESLLNWSDHKHCWEVSETEGSEGIRSEYPGRWIILIPVCRVKTPQKSDALTISTPLKGAAACCCLLVIYLSPSHTQRSVLSKGAQSSWSLLWSYLYISQFFAVLEIFENIVNICSDNVLSSLVESWVSS